jgi:hypothetical protein
MSNRELLELAAKAADIKVEWREWRTARKAEFGLIKHTKHEGFWIGGQQWNPLTDDGDALRLVVKCGLSVQIGASVFVYDHPDFCDPAYTGVETCESLKTDPFAATRRAIVRAAAEIGKAMP